MSTNIQQNIVSETAEKTVAAVKSSLVDKIKAYAYQPKFIVVGLVIVVCILLFYAYNKNKWPFAKKEGVSAVTAKGKKSKDNSKNPKEKEAEQDDDDSQSQEIDDMIDRINEKQKKNIAE